MKLTVTFPELDSQRRQIGAALSNWEIGSRTLDPRQAILDDLRRGIEIDIGEIEVGPGGLLTYKGEQVLLYIRDTRDPLWLLANEPEKSRRFHLVDCSTLDRMRREERFERYVVTNETTGVFTVDWWEKETDERGVTEAELKVCKNCLSALNWRGYKNPSDRMTPANDYPPSREDIWENFSISEFLLEYATFFRSKPSRRAQDAIPNVYVKDWPRISKQRRQAADWKCDECGVELSSNPGLLHCHHRNGVATDNSASNLRVLCALDHAAQPSHQHMKVSAEARRIIEAARVTQGIKIR